jgi:hypothetical protein
VELNFHHSNKYWKLRWQTIVLSLYTTLEAEFNPNKSLTKFTKRPNTSSFNNKLRGFFSFCHINNPHNYNTLRTTDNINISLTALSILLNFANDDMNCLTNFHKKIILP